LEGYNYTPLLANCKYIRVSIWVVKVAADPLGKELGEEGFVLTVRHDHLIR
jgi:hypothetical protein